MAQPTIVASGEADKVIKFSYQARNRDGKIVNGTAEALNRNDVVVELTRQGYVPIKIKGGGSGGLSLDSEITFRKAAKKRELVIATRQLAAMLDSGLSYIEALDIVAEDCPDHILAGALRETRAAVQNGSSMSEALAAQGAVFPPLMVNLITAGEAGGKVKDAMNRVADQLDKDDQMRAKVKKAMMYPLVVFVISAAVFAFMMLYLVPQFAETFEDIGGEGAQLPMLTQMVVSISAAAKYVVPVLLILFVPGLIWYRLNRHKDEVRRVVDPIKLKIPVLGGLFHKIALARFAHNLSGLLDAGVDRLEALEITARTVDNVTLEDAIMAAHEAQRQGRPLAEPLKDSPLFPSMVIQMVEVGERSGRTAFMLDKAAGIYDRDVDQVTDNMASLIEPLFLVFLGVMIGVIVIAIYLPYMNLIEILDG